VTFVLITTWVLRDLCLFRPRFLFVDSGRIIFREDESHSITTEWAFSKDFSEYTKEWRLKGG
jgi:hypothetical protein